MFYILGMLYLKLCQLLQLPAFFQIKAQYIFKSTNTATIKKNSIRSACLWNPSTLLSFCSSISTLASSVTLQQGGSYKGLHFRIQKNTSFKEKHNFCRNYKNTISFAYKKAPLWSTCIEFYMWSKHPNNAVVQGEIQRKFLSHRLEYCPGFLLMRLCHLPVPVSGSSQVQLLVGGLKSCQSLQPAVEQVLGGRRIPHMKPQGVRKLQLLDSNMREIICLLFWEPGHLPVVIQFCVSSQLFVEPEGYWLLLIKNCQHVI